MSDSGLAVPGCFSKQAKCIYASGQSMNELMNFFYGKRLTYNSTDYTSKTGLVSFQDTNMILVTNRNEKFNLSFLNFVIARSLYLIWHRVKQSTCSMRIKYSCFWKHKDGRVLWPIALNLWRIQKVKPWKPQIRRQNYQKRHCNVHLCLYDVLLFIKDRSLFCKLHLFIKHKLCFFRHIVTH